MSFAIISNKLQVVLVVVALLVLVFAWCWCFFVSARAVVLNLYEHKGIHHAKHESEAAHSILR